LFIVTCTEGAVAGGAGPEPSSEELPMQDVVEMGRVAQAELRDDLSALFRGAIRLMLEMVLEEELKAMVGARRFERVGSRKDHRNGTYLRRLLTSLGQIDVTVPRSRGQGSPADVIGRYQRRSLELDEMMVEAYVSGVSQRKMADVTEALMGERVGRSTVSRVAKRLDEAVQELRSAPIEGAHPYLYLDATFLDARWAKKVENVSALVAYAVGPDGHRRLLGVSLGAEESEASWSELLAELVERGLSGVQLVIADEHAGLAAAVRKVLPRHVARGARSTCSATSGRRCLIGSGSAWPATWRRSSRRPGSRSRRSYWPISRHAGTRSSQRLSRCSSAASQP
jgi:putative transposase